MKPDFEKAQQIKAEAAKEFKAQNYDLASEKYYEILNILRLNNTLKDSKDGQLLESQSRLNIALCKFNTKDYEIAIDQCERVLDKDPKNGKAAFRLAQSVYLQHDKFTNLSASKSQARMAYNYAKKASDLINNDAKIKEFYNEMKDIWQQVQEMEKPKEEEKQKEPTEAEKKGLKRVIVDDPEEKRQMDEQTKPAVAQPQ